MNRLLVTISPLLLSVIAFAGAKESETAETIMLRRSKAESGDANSQVVMGMNHLQGVPGLVNQDEVVAAELFTSAAEADDQFGQIELARCYQEGLGVPKSDSEAYKWLLVASAKGNKIAREKMATLEPLLTPTQREAGQAKAEAFRRQLSEKPRPNDLERLNLANRELGIGNGFLRKGLIMADKSEALAALPHLKTSANLGNAEAQYKLSFLLSMVPGIDDLPTSAKWLIRAAHQGQPNAQYDLAWAYTNNKSGLKTDPILARKWLKVVTRRSNPDDVIKPLEEQIHKISNEKERAEGDELAASFRAAPEI